MAVDTLFVADYIVKTLRRRPNRPVHERQLKAEALLRLGMVLSASDLTRALARLRGLATRDKDGNYFLCRWHKNNGNGESPLEKARLLVAEKKFVAARQILEASVRHGEGDRDVLTLFGECCVRLGNASRALDVLLLANTPLEDANAENLLTIFRLASRTQNYTAAVQSYSLLAARKRPPKPLQLQYARVLRNAGQYRDALDVLSGLTKGDRPAVEALLLRAYCEEALNDYRAAIKSYRRVARLSPHNGHAKMGIKFCRNKAQSSISLA